MIGHLNSGSGVAGTVSNVTVGPEEVPEPVDSDLVQRPFWAIVKIRPLSSFPSIRQVLGGEVM